MKRITYLLSTFMLGAGLLFFAWIGLTLWKGDPITTLYASREQAILRHELPDTASHASLNAVARWHASPAHAHAAFAISIPRLGLRNVIVVQGTDIPTLRKGPGHYSMTSMPGAGARHVIAVAGHRTTYGHWFRHIDDLRPGDLIYVRTSYGRYVYRVTGHRIVDNRDWSILHTRPWEKLVLTACHPLYSASHRYVVFAALR